MPLGAEMFNLAGMVFTGDWWTGGLAGKLAIAGFAPLTALALWAFGRRYISAAAGMVAAIVYLSTPWIALVSAGGLVDGAAAFYLLASVYALALWCEEHAAGQAAHRGLVLLGLLAGGAVSVKYPAVVFVVLPAAVAIGVLAGRSPAAAPTGAGPAASLGGAGRRRAGVRAAAAAVTVFVLATAVGCGPWLVKNFVATGNPVYPLAYRVFDGRTRTDEKDAQWRRAHAPPNYALSDLAERLGGVLLTSDWNNPLTIPLVALALVCRPRHKLVWPLVGYALYVLGAWWLLTHRIDRFWLPVLPLLALLAGMGATWSARPAWRWTLAGWLIVGLTYDFVVLGSGVVADSRWFASLEALRSEQRALRPAHAYLDDHVPPGQRALLVGDATPYDLTARALYNTVFDSSIFAEIARDRSPQEVSAALARLGVSHIWVDWSEIARYRSPGNYGFTPFVEPRVFADLVAAGVLEKVYNDARGEVYGVTGSAAHGP